MMKRLLEALTLGLGAAAIACSGSDELTGPADATSEAEARIVYTIEINPGHKIDFYEYAHGFTGAREILPVGEREALTLPDDSPRTLGQLFSLVRPGDEVPEELQQADLRVTKTVADLEAKLAVDPSFVPFAGEPSSTPAERPDVARIQSAAITCSADMFNDQYGAQWFIDNFGRVFSNNVRCPPGPRNSVSFSEAASLTNMFMASVRHPAGRILQWKQMEGDFTHAGKSTGLIVSPSSGLTNFVLWRDEPVPPRHIVIHTVGGPNTAFPTSETFIQGTSPCSHLHRTIVWCDRS